MKRQASGQGSIIPAGSMGILVLVPKSCFTLGRILATGDTGAVLVSGLAGECPLFVDALDCSLLSVSAYHGTTFDGAEIRAGVPVTITYTSGSSTVALRLTLSGESL